MLKTKITSILLHSLIHWQLNGYPEGKNNLIFDTFLYVIIIMYIDHALINALSAHMWAVK